VSDIFIKITPDLEQVFNNVDFVSVEDLVTKIEELRYELEELKETVEDNYQLIPIEVE